MSRFHLHVSVQDLDASIAFYTALFGAPPSVNKPDYAKWQLDDPRLNFAISTHGRKPGVDHVGIQAENDHELRAIHHRLQSAGVSDVEQSGATCCYARSDKYWSVDPQGIAWEAFHTLQEAPVFGEAPAPGQEGEACCAPKATRCC